MIVDKIHYTFIHNVFGNFARETMNYFADYLYPRFEWKVVGTYDKAVEYLNKNRQYQRETDMPMRPGLILNPSGEMDLESPYGKMAARFPNTAPGLTKYTFDPVYQDENVIVTVGFTRLKGNFDFLALVPSFYEYFDLKILLLQMFRGVDRYIYPIWVNSFIIMPPELYNFTYTNEYTGETYTLDWTKQKVVDQLIKTIDKTKKILPCNILPLYKLTGFSDASSRLGGDTDLPDWRLNFTLEYEVEIPSFFIVETDYYAKYAKMDIIRVGSTYTVNDGTTVPDIRENQTYEVIHNFNDSTSVDEVILIDDTKMSFNTRYFHVLTKSEVESTVDVPISLPEQITDTKYLLVNSRQGEVSYGDSGYELSNSGNTLLLKPTFLATQDENDVVELYLYIKDQIIEP